MTPTDAELTLREAGLRVTRPRAAVLDAVRAHPHASTETLIAAARAGGSDVSHQAVYDVLRVLVASRLVRRIEPSGSVARYEARVGDNHHHLVCRTCGAITDVDCVVGAAPCLAAADRLGVTGRPGGADVPTAAGAPLAGFVVDEAEVVLWGSCASCLARPAAVPARPPPNP